MKVADLFKIKGIDEELFIRNNKLDKPSFYRVKENLTDTDFGTVSKLIKIAKTFKDKVYAIDNKLYLNGNEIKEFEGKDLTAEEMYKELNVTYCIVDLVDATQQGSVDYATVKVEFEIEGNLTATHSIEIEINNKRIDFEDWKSYKEEIMELVYESLNHDDTYIYDELFI